VLALGNFDGLHRGHTKIIERVNRRAGERGATSVVMTFDPHPPRVVRPDKAPPLIMTKVQRLEAIAAAGIQGVAVVRFTHELSQWDPETFVRAVLVEWLHVAEVWVGANFLFGRDRAGNFSLLRTLGARYGFRAEKIDPVRYREFVVSSTRIRRLISEGRVDEAGVLLGHPYVIDGIVVEGARRGRDLGFPTANLVPRNGYVTPGHGVYACRTGDGRAAAVNVGVRPMFNTGRGELIEAYLLDFDGDLYGEHVGVEFVERLRPMLTFSGVPELLVAMAEDVSRTRTVLGLS
jgi:riboflavin kinase / FMN adenylyltransferase